jgi:hypothetical protein
MSPATAFRHSWVLAGLFLVLLQDAGAGEATYTEPRGYYLAKIPGIATEGGTKRTYLGIQLLPDIHFKGVVASVSGNTLTFYGGISLSASANPARHYYLHVLGGSGQGFVSEIDSFQTSGIQCADELPTWIQPGTPALIRYHPTIADILGTTNTYGLGAGEDADSADNVVVWNPSQQQEAVYYFNSTRSRWEQKDVVADAGMNIIRFPYGFYIVRRTPETLRILLSGEIGSESVLLPVHSGANVFSLPVNLSGSLDAIVRNSGDHAVVSGKNSANADILTFQEPSTGLQRGPFYHLSRPGVSEWREIGVNNSTASIAPLDFLSTLILHRPGDSGFVFAQGSLEPPATPRPVLPPDPETGELPLTAEFPLRQRLPAGVSLEIQTSTDLQTWSPSSNVIITSGPINKLDFPLPPGQGRAFYRLKIWIE